MVDDLMASGCRLGTTKAQAVELLGPPDSGYSLALEYHLGAERGFMRIDSETYFPPSTAFRVQPSVLPRARAYVLRVPILGLQILPVSSLLIVARSMPVRSAISARLSPWRLRSRRRSRRASINSGSATGGYSRR